MPIEVESPEQLGYENVKYNLAESSVTDTVFKNINLNIQDLKLCYGDHLGKPELRKLIASEYKGITENDVLLTAGAASALFIIATTLLEKKDHLVVLHPNYATNIETPRAIGCEIDFVNLKFEENFSFTISEIKSKIKANTKLISVTNPHNPAGTTIPQTILFELAQLAEKHNCYLLVDETYRDLTLTNKGDLAASIHNRIISVASVSKAYGLPGIRIGWLITKDEKLFEKFLAAKEQIFICNSILDEEVAYQYLLEKEIHFTSIKKHIETNLAILLEWIANENRMEMVIPKGGVVCFPRIKNQEINTTEFYNLLNTKYKTFVGPGHWFEMPNNFMRIGFGWPQSDELSQGLKNISLVLDEMKL